MTSGFVFSDTFLSHNTDVGAQHAFKARPSVLYISTHQYPYGAYSETGIGKGAMLNCPLSAGSADGDYENIFLAKIIPKIQAFKPQFIIISAGFDPHIDDPLGQMNLSTGCYGWMRSA